jgi:hypothetical protein
MSNVFDRFRADLARKDQFATIQVSLHAHGRGLLAALANICHFRVDVRCTPVCRSTSTMRSVEVVSFARYVIRELYGMRLDLDQ